MKNKFQCQLELMQELCEGFKTMIKEASEMTDDQKILFQLIHVNDRICMAGDELKLIEGK